MEKYFIIKRTVEIIHSNLFPEFVTCLKEIQDKKIYNDDTNIVINDLENIINTFLSLDLTPKMDYYISIKDKITANIDLLYSDPKYDTKFCTDLISVSYNIYK